MEKIRTGAKLRKSQVARMDRDKGDCCTFPKGPPSVRIFFYDHEDDSVRVCELAHHHDRSYEELYKQGVYKVDFGGSGSVAGRLIQCLPPGAGN